MSFPSSPTNGQIAVINNITYTYNSTVRSWTRVVSSNISSISVSGVSTMWGNTVIANTTSSSGTTTGALVVTGGAGIGGALNVGDSATVQGVNLVSNIAGLASTINTQGANLGTVVGTTIPAIQANLGTVVGTTIPGINSNVSAINANLGTVVGTTIPAIQANIGAYETYANTQIGLRATVASPSFTGVVTSAGNIVAASGTASSNTTTGALVVVGGAGVSGAVYAGSVYDNNSRVVTALTSSGAGNLTVGGAAPSLTIALPATGPGAVNVGSSTSIPTIVTDAYGRVVSLTSNAVSTTINTTGTTGTGSVSGGGTLTFSSTNGVVIAASGSTLGIATPQDLRTSAAPTFAGVTSNGNTAINGTAYISGITTITNSTNSTGAGNGALVVTGGLGAGGTVNFGGDLYVTGNIYTPNLIATSTSTLNTSSPMAYFQVTPTYPYNFDTGFYSHFVGGPANVYAHTGLVRNHNNHYWTFFSNAKSEPSGSTVNFAEAGIIYDTIYSGGAIFANTTNSTDTTTGALVVSGGVGVSGNLNVNSAGYFGYNASNTQLINPSIIGTQSSQAVNAGQYYVQMALVNNTGTGSADITSYPNNVTDGSSAFMDMGFTGNLFSDPAYTITKANDGYLFASALNGSGLGGNLVLATDKTGTYNDIVLAVGSFYSNAEVARFHGNASNSGYFQITTGTAASSTSTGALRVTGGVGVSGAVYAGSVFDNGSRAITSVTQTAGAGISISSQTSSGPAAAATITNTGVLSVSAGTGITANASTGSISITNSGVTGAVAGTGISVSSATGSVTITNTGVLSVSAGTGITANASTGSISITNSGVTSVAAGGNISVSASTGGITISGTNSGVTGAFAGTGISVSGATGGVTITNAGVTSIVAGTDISISGATGAVTVNDTSTLSSVTGRGASTATTITSTNALQAWNTTTPGLGVGGIHLGTASATSNAGPAITFGARDATSGTNAQAGIYINSDSTYGTRMYFATTDSYATGSKAAMSLTETGAWALPRCGVTINTSGVYSGKATTAQYADLAENYAADADYEPGTVLMFGGDNEVTLADLETTAVAGVVSTNPAHLMNGCLEATHVTALALQGRVPCKVYGPVRKGDMMVSAGNGYAKASKTPSLGQVIGKALENLPEGKGVIEVVVGRI